MNVFITGASSGIGEALARRYAQRGARLGLVARNGERLAALVASLPAPQSGTHLCYALDVTDSERLAHAAAEFVDAAGAPRVVIANAGISAGTLTEEPADFAVFKRIIDTNLIAMVATFAAFIGPMRTLPEARLVGIASAAGIRGLPGVEAYSASKAAAISYCESLRIELAATKIRVVTIAPGYIDTPMTQDNRYKMPFLMPVERFATQAVDVIERGASFSIIPWQMAILAGVMRVLPNFIYDRAMSRAPRKARTKP